MITVRRADSSDVAAMNRVLTASIRDLCAADHHDDPEAVAGWTRNKSIAGVTAMLANDNLALYVAETGRALAAVGAIAADNSIGLN
ncbi:MAG TPA: hypothetical protein VGM83_03765 [Devosiaceae bacterium]|jgi:hypothetical protein